MRAPILPLAAAVFVAGCASDAPRVNEYLDPQTAVTIRSLAEPLVYAHDAPELAANTRDYLSLGLVETNNMGRRKHYLALISWSTIDRHRVGIVAAPVPERVELDLGGKPLELAGASHEPRGFGIGGRLFRPPAGYSGESWYEVTPAQLRALAAAPPASIALDGDAGRISYLPWRAEARGLEEFVRDIPDAASGTR